jgi:sarcosine oxidase subunit gamma
MPNSARDLAPSCSSPLAARFACANGVERAHVNGYVAVARTSCAPHAALTLCDATHLARVGWKGRGTLEFLSALDIALPTAPNRWCADTSGALVLRLGQQDFLLADDFGVPSGIGARAQSAAAASSAACGHHVPRQHGLAAIAVWGSASNDLLARLCAIDLRPRVFGADAVAQTQLASISVTLMRRDRAQAPGYLIFVDTSLALYLWDLVWEVAAPLDARIVGFAQVP